MGASVRCHCMFIAFPVRQPGELFKTKGVFTVYCVFSLTVLFMYGVP